ncbi:hypothetical protein IAQ61_009589 [Plenodomus lingam]|uniref:uncharacterized protein n=1 Tax=Leptosphaeria maculans TaxID=5022 RepID=UPI00332F8EF2|nr:hypothetical protein IAQ61_009589 [Plenodomus lingam]
MCSRAQAIRHDACQIESRAKNKPLSISTRQTTRFLGQSAFHVPSGPTAGHISVSLVAQIPLPLQLVQLHPVDLAGDN